MPGTSRGIGEVPSGGSVEWIEADLTGATWVDGLQYGVVTHPADDEITAVGCKGIFSGTNTVDAKTTTLDLTTLTGGVIPKHVRVNYTLNNSGAKNWSEVICFLNSMAGSGNKRMVGLFNFRRVAPTDEWGDRISTWISKSPDTMYVRETVFLGTPGEISCEAEWCEGGYNGGTHNSPQPRPALDVEEADAADLVFVFADWGTTGSAMITGLKVEYAL